MGMDKKFDEIKEEIKNYILEEFLPKSYELKDEELLFESGIFDSLGLIELITFIKENFKIFIKPSEVTLDNFNTINKIAKIVSEKINNHV